MMMKKLCLILAMMAMTATINAATSVTLMWDPNTEPELAGYMVYYGTGSGTYSQTIDVGNITNCPIFNLENGQRYYFVVTAYDAGRFESEPSVEVNYKTPFKYSLDGSYSASAEFVMNSEDGVITGNVASLPADPKSVGWAKNLAPVTAGQVVRINARMSYNNGRAPVSFYLVDGANGCWVSPERVVYVDGSYGSNSVDLIVSYACNSPRLYVSTGQKVGGYEFQQIQVSAITPAVSPIADLYLRQLLPKQSVGLYSAEWLWSPAPGSEGYVIRITPFRDEVEKGAVGIMFTTQTLPASQTNFRRDIDAASYGGVYVAVSSIVGGQESTPWITWYLPGDIFNTADEDIPPLCFQGSVDTVDVNYAYAGYTSSRRTTALIPGLSAGREERTDIDNNAYAGRVSDYSFIRSQNIKGWRMQ